MIDLYKIHWNTFAKT